MHLWRERIKVFLKENHIFYNLLELAGIFEKAEGFLGKKADDKPVGRTKSTHSSSTTRD